MRDVLFVLSGLISGVLSGGFGVGGAVITTPLIRALGVTPIFAIASTLPAVLPSAITGSIRYQKEKLINWALVAQTVPAGIVFAVIGAKFSPSIPGRGHLQMVATAVIVGIVGYRMGRSKDGDPHVHEYHAYVPATIGAFAGSLSGLLGVGGGAITVPGFRQWTRIPLKSAIATSLTCVGIFAIPSTITHAIAHHINWRVAIELAVGVVPGAAIGSRLALRTKERVLRLSVSISLGVIAFIYGALEVRALLH